MNDRKQALIALRNAIRDGDTQPFSPFRRRTVWNVLSYENAASASNAVHLKDVNAALALLEATLPGWIWILQSNSETCRSTLHHPKGSAVAWAEGEATIPATALVIANIEALIEREDDA